MFQQMEHAISLCEGRPKRAPRPRLIGVAPRSSLSFEKLGGRQ